MEFAKVTGQVFEDGPGWLFLGIVERERERDRDDVWAIDGLFLTVNRAEYLRCFEFPRFSYQPLIITLEALWSSWGHPQ